MIVERIDQPGGGMDALDRHQLEALLRHGVRERDGETEFVFLRGEAADGRDDAGGADGDGARVDLAAGGMAEDARGRDDLVVVEEGLAHAHEDDAAHRPVGLAPDGEHLADDLVREEVPLEAELAGGAEGAGERAARLAGDADDVLLLLARVRARVGAGRLARHGNAHRLDLRAAVQLEEVLEEAVSRGLAAQDAQREGAGGGLDRFQHRPPHALHAAQVRLAAADRGSK